MKPIVLAAALTASVGLLGASAQAFPTSLSGTIPTQAPAPGVIKVRNACGVGWHRGPYGYCRPNGAPYAYRPYAYRPYAYYAPPPPVRCWWVATRYGSRRVCSW
jgi:hypothetical protein